MKQRVRFTSFSKTKLVVSSVKQAETSKSERGALACRGDISSSSWDNKAFQPSDRCRSRACRKSCSRGSCRGSFNLHKHVLIDWRTRLSTVITSTTRLNVTWRYELSLDAGLKPNRFVTHRPRPRLHRDRSTHRRHRSPYISVSPENTCLVFVVRDQRVSSRCFKLILWPRPLTRDALSSRGRAYSRRDVLFLPLLGAWRNKTTTESNRCREERRLITGSRNLSGFSRWLSKK